MRQLRSEEVKVKVRDLQLGDKVDIEKSQLPFEYADPASEFEYGIVDSVMEETQTCWIVSFNNMGGFAIGPDFQLAVVRD
jgi:hypothetical protein